MVIDMALLPLDVIADVMEIVVPDELILLTDENGWLLTDPEGNLIAEG